MTSIADSINSQIKTTELYRTSVNQQIIQQQHNIKKIVNLSSNENPLGASPLVTSSLQKSINKIHLYPENDARLLKHALAEKNNIRPEQISIGAGSSEIIHQLYMLFVSPADEVIITEHGFALYRILCHKMSAQCRVAADDNFQQNCSNILQCISAKTKMIIIANPNNPTASWLNAQALKKLLCMTPKHIAIVIDEAYFEYMATHSTYTSACYFLKKHENLIVVRTFSKIYALAGLRIGYAISSEAISHYLNRLRNPFNVGSLAMIAAYHALLDTEHTERALETNQQSQNMLQEFLTGEKISYLPPCANFITLKLDTQGCTQENTQGKTQEETQEETQEDTQENNQGNTQENNQAYKAAHTTPNSKASILYNELLKNGIIVRPLAAYHMKDYLRISTGTAENTTTLCHHMRRHIKKGGLKYTDVVKS